MKHVLVLWLKLGVDVTFLNVPGHHSCKFVKEQCAFLLGEEFMHWKCVGGGGGLIR